MRHLTCFLLSCAAVVALASHARADAISPPPTDCVPGSMGVGCHGPPRCAPADCATDGDCGPGHQCLPTPLCIETISCGGITTTMDPNVTGQCLTGHCAIGGTCTTRMVCVPSAAPVDDALDLPSTPDMPAPTDMPASSDMTGGTDAGGARSSYGCCSTAGVRGGAGAALLCVGLLSISILRRRRQ